MKLFNLFFGRKPDLRPFERRVLLKKYLEQNNYNPRVNVGDYIIFQCRLSKLELFLSRFLVNTDRTKIR